MVKVNKFNPEQAVKTSFKEEFSRWLHAVADSGKIETPIEAGILQAGILHAVKEYLGYIWCKDGLDSVEYDLQEAACYGIIFGEGVYRAVGIETPDERRQADEEFDRRNRDRLDAQIAERETQLLAAIRVSPVQSVEA